MRRPAIITLTVVTILVLAAGLMYAFGTPQTGPSDTLAGAGSVVGSDVGGTETQPAMGGGDPSAQGRTAPEADPNSPLAIQIPGCVCHSDDPKLVKEHESYRMNQCAGCHVNGTPTGQ